MAFNTYNTYGEGLKIASDLAQRAVLAESSLASLPPLASPIPALQKAFPLYITAAEHYSHLLASKLVPEADKAGVKRKWRLVLERAEKVKARIEELGGQVGKVGVSDEGEEEAIRRRGGRVNGLDLPLWRKPPDRDFELGKDGSFRAMQQPDLPVPAEVGEVEWAECPASAWDYGESHNERWAITQGVGADCSVVAGLGVCLEHSRRWKRSVALRSLAPTSIAGNPIRSENSKHVLKLMLNGDWRAVVIDALLPRDKGTQRPLHSVSYPLRSGEGIASGMSTVKEAGPAWIPLVLKAFFLAHGGYSLPGSNPGPDIYALTGWIPERISLLGGFQREKEWIKLQRAWTKGQVLVTLGTGKEPGQGLIPLHAYAVLDVQQVGPDQILEIFDPGLPAEPPFSTMEVGLAGLNVAEGGSSARKTGLFTMTWDEVCSEFEALNLNWDPSLYPVTDKRHWSWPKLAHDTQSSDTMYGPPRYTLDITSAVAGTEVAVLLSQHIVNKDRPLDDIALHVTDRQAGHQRGTNSLILDSPYSNTQHVLYRHVIRSGTESLLVLPLRDRGISRTDFTLQAFSPAGTSINLERVSTSLPFSQTVAGALTSRSAGGHSGWPTFASNPQYRVTIGNAEHSSGSNGEASWTKKAELRIQVVGDGEMTWNAKCLWSDGGTVYGVSEEAVIADTGAYSYGHAFAQATVSPGVYTVIVSSFEPMVTGKYTLSIESSMPVSIAALPPEGAGMYHRMIEGKWSAETAGGRPSQNSYHLNPHIELLAPSTLTIQCRLHHIDMGQNIPLNLTLFTRKEGGGIGEQKATSGPYSDTVSGVRIARTKPGAIQSGVYVLVPSAYERGEGKGKRWRVDVWADGPFSLELPRT